MIEQKYAYPLMLTSQFYYCSMPLRLDSYRGCPSECLYCFARLRNGNFSSIQQYADPRSIQRLFEAAFEKDGNPDNVLVECLRNRLPLHFGGMSDPFLGSKSALDTTLAIMDLLKRYNYPTLISTKSAVIDNARIKDAILENSFFAIQISFSSFDDTQAKHLEPKAPLPSERLKGARELLKGGAWVSCRLQPYFPSGDVDRVFDTIMSNGFKHLTLEHFKLPFDRKIDLQKISEIIGHNPVKWFPKNHSVKRGREFEMPNKIRLESIRKFRDKCLRHGIPIGVADNGFQHLSTSSCCCGIDSLKGFENWFKHNITVAVCRSKSEIEYKTIAKEWVPKKSIARMINSKTRLGNVADTVVNHLREHWKHNRQFSPAMFYGVVAKKEHDCYKYYLRSE